MKNVRVKVRRGCSGIWWGFGIYDGEKLLFVSPGDTYLNKYRYKTNVIRYAKAMAKRIGIPYDPEIVKQHGC